MPVAYAASAPGDGTVKVRVVREVNANGVWGRIPEPGLNKVKVTLTDDAGHTISATTGRDGTATEGRPSSNTGALSSTGEFIDIRGANDAEVAAAFWNPAACCQKNADLVTFSYSTRGDHEDNTGFDLPDKATTGADLDKDGIQGPGEKPVPGAAAHLYGASGKKAASTNTTSRGEHCFDTPLYKGTATKRDAGKNDVIDSDGKVPARRFPEHTVTTGSAGQGNPAYGFGYQPLSEPGRITLVKRDEKTKRPTGRGVREVARE